jgi:hypothetical protein
MRIILDKKKLNKFPWDEILKNLNSKSIKNKTNSNKKIESQNLYTTRFNSFTDGIFPSA